MSETHGTENETTAEERAGWVNHVLEKDKIKDCEGHDAIIEKLLNERDRLETANEGLVRQAREIGRREGALTADVGQAETQLAGAAAQLLIYANNTHRGRCGDGGASNGLEVLKECGTWRCNQTAAFLAGLEKHEGGGA